MLDKFQQTVEHTANIEIREYIKWSLIRGFNLYQKNNRKSLSFLAQKVFAVAYGKWSFTIGSSSECFGVLDRQSLMGGGRTWRFDCK